MFFLCFTPLLLIPSRERGRRRLKIKQEVASVLKEVEGGASLAIPNKTVSEM